jgi:hypothetical protein
VIVLDSPGFSLLVRLKIFVVITPLPGLRFNASGRSLEIVMSLDGAVHALPL